MSEQIFRENTDGLKVLTDQGYKDFKGVAFMGVKPIWRVVFGERWLECTHDHRLFVADGDDLREVRVHDLQVGDLVMPTEVPVTAIVDTGREEAVYDLIGVDGERYLTNDILSHNCEFVTDDETLIDGLKLVNFHGIDPVDKLGQIRFYKQIDPNRTYLVSLDPSSGTGGDFSAIQVFQLPEMVQLAEWRHNKTDIKGQVSVMLQILGHIYKTLKTHAGQVGEPDLYWTYENNGGYGDAVELVLNDIGEENFPGELVNEPRRARGNGGRFKRGLTTTNKNKLTACMKLKSLIETDRMQVYSKMLTREFKFFVSRGQTFAAKIGETDDLVMATIQIVRMLLIIQHWDDSLSESLKETIDLDDFEIEPMPIFV